MTSTSTAMMIFRIFSRWTSGADQGYPVPGVDLGSVEDQLSYPALLAKKARLRKQIKTVQKQIKIAKRAKKSSKQRRLTAKLRKLKRQLRNL